MDEGEANRMLGLLTLTTATGEATDGLCGFVEQRANAGTATPLHVHHRDGELFHVIEGHVTYSVDGEVVEAPAGSTVYGPAGVPHAFRVDEDGTRLLDIRRAGTEGFFAAAGRPATGIEIPGPGSDPEAEMARRGCLGGVRRRDPRPVTARRDGGVVRSRRRRALAPVDPPVSRFALSP
jgi:mannose-6-phosphate isomerase-like protein (cupin superfamily)